MRGVKGNFEAAIETFMHLRKIDNIESFFAFTMYGPNNNDIFNLLEKLKEYIPDISFKDIHLNLPQNSGHYYGNSSVNIDSNNNIFNIIDKFEASLSSKADSLKITEHVYRHYAKKFLATKEMPMTCSAMMSSVYISELGDVFPCTIWDKKIGSLRDVDFDISKIISKSDYKKTREDIKKNNCPKCWTPCEAFPTIAANLNKVVATYF